MANKLQHETRNRHVRKDRTENLDWAQSQRRGAPRRRPVPEEKLVSSVLALRLEERVKARLERKRRHG